MDRLYTTAFTVPANTPLAAPVSLPVALEDAWLETVRLIIPDGHNGLTGLAVLWGGVGIIPAGQGTYIVANDETFDVSYRGEITTAGIVLSGFNLDVFAHTFYVRWQVTDAPESPAVTVASPQAAGAAQPDITGTADLTSADLPDASLPDVGTGFGDDGQAVPDLALPPDIAASADEMAAAAAAGSST